MKIKLELILICLLGFTVIKAQECIIPAGNNSQGDGGSISYTVGQVMYNTYSGTNGSVVEGIQQPYEIYVITAMDETPEINLLVRAFPNPTINNILLEIKDFDLSSLSFLLYDMKGNLLQQEKIKNQQTSVLMSHLASGTYLMKVIQGEKEIKSFKIIKK